MTKTYKREVGGAVLALWFAVSIRVFFFAWPETVEALGDIYVGFTAVVLPAGLAPFITDAVIKHKKASQDSLLGKVGT